MTRQITCLLHESKHSKTTLNDRLGTIARNDAGDTADNITLISSMTVDLLTDLGNDSSKLINFKLASSPIFARRQAMNIEHYRYK